MKNLLGNILLVVALVATLVGTASVEKAEIAVAKAEAELISVEELAEAVELEAEAIKEEDFCERSIFWYGFIGAFKGAEAEVKSSGKSLVVMKDYYGDVFFFSDYFDYKVKTLNDLNSEIKSKEVCCNLAIAKKNIVIATPTMVYVMAILLRKRK